MCFKTNRASSVYELALSAAVRGERVVTALVLAQVAREASQRVLGLRPFDVQLIGAMILHKGEIAEMRTGEGKTLVAVLPAYLNALSGKGVHVRSSAPSLEHLTVCPWACWGPLLPRMQHAMHVGTFLGHLWRDMQAKQQSILKTLCEIGKVLCVIGAVQGSSSWCYRVLTC